MTDLPVPDFGLGRRPAPDAMDHLFLLAPLLVDGPLPAWRYWWADGWWGDQGQTPQCVEYAWHHWMTDAPVTHRGALWTPGSRYPAFQRNDEWDGEDYDGTSVRAGAKVLQQLGLIGTYVWGFDGMTVARCVLGRAPVVAGTNWYRSMFYPDAKGRITIDGPLDGGHAYVLDGYNATTRMFRIKNSWGRGWGRNGFAYIGFDDMARLIAEDGEACIATETRPAVITA